MSTLTRIIPVVLFAALVFVGCDASGVAPETESSPDATVKRIDPPCSDCDDGGGGGGGGSNPYISSAYSDASYAYDNGPAVRLSGQTLASESVDIVKVTVNGYLEGQLCGSSTDTKYNNGYANIGSPVVSCNVNGPVNTSNVGSNGYHYIEKDGYSTSTSS